MNDLVSRCSKRVFRQYIQSVSSSNLSSAVAHYLNCYLSNSNKLASSNTNTSILSSTNLNQTNNDTKPTPDNIEQTINNKISNKKRKKNQRKNNKLGKLKF